MTVMATHQGLVQEPTDVHAAPGLSVWRRRRRLKPGTEEGTWILDGKPFFFLSAHCQLTEWSPWPSSGSNRSVQPHRLWHLPRGDQVDTNSVIVADAAFLTALPADLSFGACFATAIAASLIDSRVEQAKKRPQLPGTTRLCDCVWPGRRQQTEPPVEVCLPGLFPKFGATPEFRHSFRIGLTTWLLPVRLTRNPENEWGFCGVMECVARRVPALVANSGELPPTSVCCGRGGNSSTTEQYRVTSQAVPFSGNGHLHRDESERIHLIWSLT